MNCCHLEALAWLFLTGSVAIVVCYCWTCFKPVTPGQTPTTKQVSWVIIAHRMIQKWNWRWWSALPAVRQYAPQWNWFEGYATHKYNLQLDRFVERD